MHQSSHAPVQLYTNAAMHQCSYAPVQPCIKAARHQCSEAPNAAMHQCSHAPIQPCTNFTPLYSISIWGYLTRPSGNERKRFSIRVHFKGFILIDRWAMFYYPSNTDFRKHIIWILVFLTGLEKYSKKALEQSVEWKAEHSLCLSPLIAFFYNKSSSPPQPQILSHCSIKEYDARIQSTELN